MQQRQLFETIFSDAHIIDIDMSAWDKLIRLYVIADHAERSTPGRLPLFAVEFVRVHQWNMFFNHSSATLIELGPNEHLHWLPYEFTISEDQAELIITLWGSPTTPRLTIVCEDVLIREVSYTSLDKTFPDWSKPRRGFVRPSIEGFSRLGIQKK